LAALLFLRTFIVQKGKRWDLEGESTTCIPLALVVTLPPPRPAGPMLFLYFLSAASLGATAVRRIYTENFPFPRKSLAI